MNKTFLPSDYASIWFNAIGLNLKTVKEDDEGSRAMFQSNLTVNRINRTDLINGSKRSKGQKQAKIRKGEEGRWYGTLISPFKDGLRIENEQQNIYDFCGLSDGDLSWDFIKVIDCKKVWKGFFLLSCLVGKITAWKIENSVPLSGKIRSKENLCLSAERTKTNFLRRFFLLSADDKSSSSLHLWKRDNFHQQLNSNDKVDTIKMLYSGKVMSRVRRNEQHE